VLLFAARADASCAWRPGELLKVSGETDQGGLRGTFSRIVEPASGRFAETVDVGILKNGSGFDGRLAWSQDVSGTSHYLTSDFARRLAVSEAWLSSHLACPVPRATHVALDARSGLNVWHFKPANGAPIELAYDRRSGRLVRATLQYSENRLIHHYSDWREVAPGKLLPFVRRDEDPEDQDEAVYMAKHVDRRRTASFDPPPPPDDSRIAGGTTTTIPFEDDNGHRVYLPVYLNGKGPFAFELDNGGHFIVTGETAKALGLTAQGSFASTGAGNDIRQAGYTKIAELRVGKAIVANQTAKVLPLSHNERPGLLPRAGILGLEFFERFIVGIDHRNKTVSLQLISDAPASHAGRPIRLLFDEDAPLVSGGYAGWSGNVMLDIGNAGSTIIEDYWAQQHGLRSKLTSGTLIDSEWLSTGSVRLGPFTLDNVKVAYFGPAERGSESTHSVAEIAGEPLLSRFNAVYDYAHQNVWLEPLPSVQPER
jgi:hypothetical protein